MNLSLRAKFILISVVVQGLVLWALIWNSFRIMDDAVKKNAYRFAHEYAVTLNLSLSPYASTGDLKVLNAFMSELLSDPHESLIRYVTVSDQTGKVILSVGQTPLDMTSLFRQKDREYSQSLKTEKTDSVLNVQAPLMLQNNLIGTFNFGISIEDLEQTRFAILRQDIFISVTGFLLGVLLLYFFTWGIGRRLSTLTTQSKKLADGNFEGLLSETGGDELEVFSRSLNSMSQSLRTRIVQLNQAEKLLLESEARFKILFNTAPVPLAVTDEKDHIIATNMAWADVTAQSQDSVFGKHTSEIDFWKNSDERDRIFEIFQKTGHVRGEIAEIIFANGQIGEIAIWSSSLNLDGHECTVWAMQDMTEELKAKRDLSIVNTSLEKRVAERSAELKRAYNDLSKTLDTLKETQRGLVSAEKMAALGSLVAGIAHELNTPIGNSLLTASTLVDRVSEFNRLTKAGGLKRSALTTYLDEIAKGCSMIVASLDRAAQLVSSFKQVAIDQTNDQRRVFNLEQLLQDTLSTYSPRLKTANCHCILDIQGSFIIESYPGSLCQVMNNLINNALIHGLENRHSGTITIRVLRVAESGIKIIFADDGAGMSEHVLHHIFEPFFTTKLGRGGNGLGMNIVYNIVTGILGGTITIDTEIDIGTTVNLNIPIVAPDRLEPGKMKNVIR